MPRDILFQSIEPYQTGRLAVDDIHTLYWEQCGRPDGVPVVYLHGGPGAGCADHHRRFFDPGHWRIVLFDQRGAGRSTPHAETRANTTGHLVADMEALREHLGIERWHLFGGSWGSTLALAYAVAHPDRVLSLVLRGVFLLSQGEVDWFMQGMGRFFPEAHARFARHLPQAERGDLLEAYYRRLTGPDRDEAEAAAREWTIYETSCSTLHPPEEPHAQGYSLALARLEAHYMRNNVIPAPGLLAQVERIRHIPGIIVQGRYDLVCPPATAWALSCAWPEALLQLIPAAGHSSREPGVLSALLAATEKMKRVG